MNASALALPDAVPGATAAAPEALRQLAELAQESLGRQPIPEAWCDEAPAEHLIKALGHLSAAGNFVPLLTDGTLTAPDRALLQAHCARAAIFLALLAFQP